MLSLFFAFQVTLISGCDFKTGFQKALNDIDTKSYGANPDQWCSQSVAEELKKYKTGYELGRENGPQFKEFKITEVPEGEQEMRLLLKEAETRARYEKMQSELEALRKQVKDQSGQIEGLKTDSTNLQNKVDRVLENNK